jgi:hypothetical protein
MNCLIVIPTNALYPESFSAPVAWLFADHVHKVRGVYEWELTPELIRKYDYFIVELNWFLQLAGFANVVNTIRQHNSGAKILFGGLYAALQYREVFARMQVDYFIKGDNELPIKMFLDDAPIRSIPNLIGRDFENEHSYFFSSDDIDKINFNLDWFPSSKIAHDRLLNSPIDEMYANHSPIYPLPMVFTTKGGCLSRHEGCGYCLGARHSKLSELYGRRIITLENEMIIQQFKKIEKRFSAATFFVLSPPDYDFSGHHFNLDIFIEFDSMASVDQVAKIMKAFRSARAHVALYTEGITGSSKRIDAKEFMNLEDDKHKIYFFGNTQDQEIPSDHLLYVNSVLPEWTNYNVYMNFESAMKISEFLKPDPRLMDQPLVRAQLTDVFMKRIDPILNQMAKESLKTGDVRTS